MSNQYFWMFWLAGTIYLAADKQFGGWLYMAAAFVFLAFDLFRPSIL